MIYVLDSSAIIAYLDNEPGATVVDSLLNDLNNSCFAHSINLCEVYYNYIRKTNAQTAKRVIGVLRNAGLIERQDMGVEFWERVGSLKAKGGISLADCFCLVLAEELSGEVVTSDRKEFGPFVALKICPIRFIR